MSPGYWNEINPKEVREVIRNDDCYRTRAEADAALEASGRFKRQNETQVWCGRSDLSAQGHTWPPRKAR
jgi:hypothetical protein